MEFVLIILVGIVVLAVVSSGGIGKRDKVLDSLEDLKEVFDVLGKHFDDLPDEVKSVLKDRCDAIKARSK
jgi:hypothetical protein